VLSKTSAADYDTEWATASAGSSLPVQPLLTTQSNVHSGLPGVHIYSAQLTAYSMGAADRITYAFFAVTSQVTITNALLRVTTSGTAAARLRVGIYNSSSAAVPTSLVADLGEVVASTTGRKAVTGLSTTLQPGYYFTVVVANEAMTFEMHGGYCPWFSNHPVANNAPIGGFQGIIIAYGALPANAPAATGASHTAHGLNCPVTFKWTA
jgi:hypothetical protein